MSWPVRIFTAVLLLQAVALVWFAYFLFDDISRAVFSDNPPSVPGTGGTTAAYASFFGILTVVVVGLWIAATKLLMWRAGGEHED